MRWEPIKYPVLLKNLKDSQENQLEFVDVTVQCSDGETKINLSSESVLQKGVLPMFELWHKDEHGDDS